MFIPGVSLFLQRPLLFTKTFFTLDVQTIFGTPALVRAMLFSAKMEEAKVERYTGLFGKESFRAFLEMMFYLPKPKKVKSPVLVLGAANDAILSSRDIENTGRAYQGVAKIFPDMAHDMMLEDNWEEAAKYTVDWLRMRGL